MRFVCFLWRGRGFWKKTARYDARHVARLAAMLKRHGGHSLTCVQDGSFDLPVGVDQVIMPWQVAALPDYLPKLWAWSPELRARIGERFAVIDLDVVILADPAMVLGTGDPILLWDHAAREHYNTSLFALSPCAGSEVWRRLSPEAVTHAQALAPYWTGDQSWVGHVLGAGMPTFGEGDGVIQYRPKIHRASVPSGTVAAFMCGPYEPFSEAEHSQWVRQAYR